MRYENTSQYLGEISKMHLSKIFNVNKDKRSRYINVSLHSYAMRWRRRRRRHLSIAMRVSLSFLASPGERAGHVDGSPTRECQVLLPRSIVPSPAVREGCCAARPRANQAERVSRAIELLSSIRDISFSLWLFWISRECRR